MPKKRHEEKNLVLYPTHNVENSHSTESYSHISPGLLIHIISFTLTVIRWVSLSGQFPQNSCITEHHDSKRGKKLNNNKGNPQHNFPIFSWPGPHPIDTSSQNDLKESLPFSIFSTFLWYSANQILLNVQDITLEGTLLKKSPMVKPPSQLAIIIL